MGTHSDGKNVTFGGFSGPYFEKKEAFEKERLARRRAATAERKRLGSVRLEEDPGEGLWVMVGVDPDTGKPVWECREEDNDE